MLNPNPYMMLSGALGFSASDLNANRLGVLTPYQRERLLSKRSKSLIWPILFTLFLVVIGLAFEVTWLFIIFLAACLGSIMIATWLRYQEDFERPVEMITGKWSFQPAYLGRYAGMVGGQKFNLPKNLSSVFSENFRYRLYYTPGTRTILSAEIV